MATYSMIFKQAFPKDLKEIWDYISNPANLAEITPDDMNFRVTNEIPDKIYPGLIITYTVSPLFKIPLSWCTRIAHVEEAKYFVDEQMEGPFSFWHHQHWLAPIQGGTLMTDILHYRIPLGIVGQVLQQPVIKPRLQQIFNYRFRKLEQRFGALTIN